MKRVIGLILAIVMVLTIGAFGQASAVSGAADNAAVAITRGNSVGDSAYAGGIITVKARHCEKYLAQYGAKVWDDLSPADFRAADAACKADESTVYSMSKGHNTAVNSGISWRAYVMGSGMPASSGVGTYMALTSDTTVPGATQCAYIATTGAVATADCALGTGEYTTVGLGRALGTFAYGGAATYTLDKTWTCSSCSSSVVAAVGIYDRAYGSPKGVLIWWYKFGSSVTLNGSDQIQVTDTITITLLDAPPLLRFDAPAAMRKYALDLAV